MGQGSKRASHPWCSEDRWCAAGQGAPNDPSLLGQGSTLHRLHLHRDAPVGRGTVRSESFASRWSDDCHLCRRSECHPCRRSEMSPMSPVAQSCGRLWEVGRKLRSAPEPAEADVRADETGDPDWPRVAQRVASPCLGSILVRVGRRVEHSSARTSGASRASSEPRPLHPPVRAVRQVVRLLRQLPAGPPLLRRGVQQDGSRGERASGPGQVQRPRLRGGAGGPLRRGVCPSRAARQRARGGSAHTGADGAATGACVGGIPSRRGGKRCGTCPSFPPTAPRPARAP
jgi:hypothetical protein